MRLERNSAYRERARWELSPGGVLIWRALCIAILAVLVLTGRFIEMLTFIALWSAAEIIEAVR